METFRRRAFWTLVVMNAIWGMSYAISKRTLEVVPPATLAALRFWVGGLALCWFVPTDTRKMTRRDWRDLILVGGVGITLSFIIHYTGLKATTATKTAIEIALEPMILVLMASVALRETIGRRTWWSATVSLCGTILLVTGGKDLATLGAELRGGGEVYGDLLVLGSVVLGAFYTVMAKGVSGRIGAMRATAISTMIGAVLLTPFGLYEVMTGPAIRWSLEVAAVIAFFGLICTALGYYLWNEILVGCRAADMALSLNVQPLAGMLTGALWLGERLPLAGWLGAALIIVGVALAPPHAEPATAGPVAPPEPLAGPVTTVAPTATPS